jgi:SAM-dependent methyltransferase
MVDTDSTQKTAFLAQEGDRWFERNRDALASASPLRDRLLSRIADQIPPDRHSCVLEIGCGHGANLAALSALRPIDGHGIEPSAQAVHEGQVQHPGLFLQVGTADNLPHASASMDVVWFGFCLYLVDRSLLHRAVAEADRVLRDGGLLAIVDFDPEQPCKRPYHHRAGLYSYKMDYSKLFLADPAYALVDKLSVSHTLGGWDPDPQERVSLTLCRKDLAHAYRTL